MDLWLQGVIFSMSDVEVMQNYSDQIIIIFLIQWNTSLIAKIINN